MSHKTALIGHQEGESLTGEAHRMRGSARLAPMLETYRRTVASAEVSVGNRERHVRRDKERLRRAETALKALPRQKFQR